VVHLANVKNNQRRFAPTPAHITGITGPLHRNTQEAAEDEKIETAEPYKLAA
jgi:hypothetical protein